MPPVPAATPRRHRRLHRRYAARLRGAVEGLGQPVAAEVEDVVVGQYAHVWPGDGQARQLRRFHAVVDALPGAKRSARVTLASRFSTHASGATARSAFR